MTSPAKVEEAVVDAASHDRFINRELSWLAFNQRVLDEASNTSHPLLERVRFLSISASNLDEFYMVRVAGLKAQVSMGVKTPSADGLTPSQQLSEINARVGALMDDQQTCWQSLRRELRDAGIAVLDPGEITEDEREWLERTFVEEIFPILTPLAIDPAHPFPFLPNRGFSLALQMINRHQDQELNALVPIPFQINRFIRLPGDAIRFVLIEDVVLMFLDRLFPGFATLDHGVFRVIRDSEMEIDEEAEDLVKTFETALKRRRRGSVIRLTVDTSMPESLRDFVRKELGVAPEDVFQLDGLIGLADTKEIIVDDRIS